MKKNILIAFIGNLVAFSAIAAPTFIGDLSTASADVTVSKATELFIDVSDVNMINKDLPLVGQRIFYLNVGSDSADTKISFAGANNTVLRVNGTIQSNPKEDGTSLTGMIRDFDVSRIADDVAYFPDSANKANNDARALLFGGDKRVYQVVVDGHSSTGLTVGEYVFDFVAQSYTE